MSKQSAQPMPVFVATALVAVGLALLLRGLSLDTSTGAALAGGGTAMMIVTVMLAVAGRLRK